MVLSVKRHTGSQIQSAQSRAHVVIAGTILSQKSSIKPHQVCNKALGKHKPGLCSPQCADHPLPLFQKQYWKHTISPFCQIYGCCKSCKGSTFWYEFLSFFCLCLVKRVLSGPHGGGSHCGLMDIWKLPWAGVLNWFCDELQLALITSQWRGVPRVTDCLSDPPPPLLPPGILSQRCSAAAAKKTWRPVLRKAWGCVSSTCPRSKCCTVGRNAATATWRREKSVTVVNWRWESYSSR